MRIGCENSKRKLGGLENNKGPDLSLTCKPYPIRTFSKVLTTVAPMSLDEPGCSQGIRHVAAVELHSRVGTCGCFDCRTVRIGVRPVVSAHATGAVGRERAARLRCADAADSNGARGCRATAAGRHCRTDHDASGQAALNIRYSWTDAVADGRIASAGISDRRTGCGAAGQDSIPLRPGDVVPTAGVHDSVYFKGLAGPERRNSVGPGRADHYK